jgi:hypothetical protein
VVVTVSGTGGTSIDVGHVHPATVGFRLNSLIINKTISAKASTAQAMSAIPQIISHHLKLLIAMKSKNRSNLLVLYHAFFVVQVSRRSIKGTLHFHLSGNLAIFYPTDSANG